MEKIIENNFNIFVERGGEFLLPFSNFVDKALKIKAIIFDWDGVFNSGVKGDNVYSGFSEPDSMGLNILRFGYTLKTGKLLLAGIISGENNPSTEKFVKREHLNFKCLGFKNKIEGLTEVMKEFSLKQEEIAFVFDDILDLTVAEKCGLRFQISRKAAPMFCNYVKDNKLADYITFSVGEEFAVREIAELLLSALNIYPTAVKSRIDFDEKYSKYITERNSINPVTYSPKTSY